MKYGFHVMYLHSVLLSCYKNDMTDPLHLELNLEGEMFITFLESIFSF